MKFAYADPPYLGCGKLYAKNHPEAWRWDEIQTHAALTQELVDRYPDGWAMSASSVSLWSILPMCPAKCRIMAWVKPFAIFKPGVGLAYTWEPVILWGGRKITRQQKTVRDHLSCNITLKKGLTGAKPQAFNEWILSALNYEEGDTLDDIFPGTGSMALAMQKPPLLSATIKEKP